MLVISGRSRITEELGPLLPLEEVVRCVARPGEMPAEGDRFIIVNGFLCGLAVADQTDDEIVTAWTANAAGPMAAIDCILAANDHARICVIGSESGFSGSFDGAYAAAKAGLHAYVETKRLRTPAQQLVGIAPGIIADTGMTDRRTDTANLARRLAAHPKQRFITPREVARLIHFLLYVDDGYISGTVIRMHGGAGAR